MVNERGMRRGIPAFRGGLEQPKRPGPLRGTRQREATAHPVTAVAGSFSQYWSELTTRISWGAVPISTTDHPSRCLEPECCVTVCRCTVD